MKRLAFALLFSLPLAACASPYLGASSAQLASLSDHEVCRALISYRTDPAMAFEAGRRGLQCTYEQTTCMGYGLAASDPGMPFCAQMVAQQATADALAFQASARQDYALREFGDNSNARHIFRHGY